MLEQCGFFLRAGDGQSQVGIGISLAWQARLHCLLQQGGNGGIVQGFADDTLQVLRCFVFWQQLQCTHTIAPQCGQQGKRRTVAQPVMLRQTAADDVAIWQQVVEIGIHHSATVCGIVGQKRQ